MFRPKMDTVSCACYQSRQELATSLGDDLDDSLKQRLGSEPTHEREVSRVSSDWLKWCRSHKGRVAVVDSCVPKGILSDGEAGGTATLADIKVSGGKRRVPDDKIYNENPDLRLRVARGNTVLVTTKPDGTVSHDGVVFALRKFTGTHDKNKHRFRWRNEKIVVLF